MWASSLRLQASPSWWTTMWCLRRKWSNTLAILRAFLPAHCFTLSRYVVILLSASLWQCFGRLWQPAWPCLDLASPWAIPLACPSMEAGLTAFSSWKPETNSSVAVPYCGGTTAGLRWLSVTRSTLSTPPNSDHHWRRLKGVAEVVYSIALWHKKALRGLQGLKSILALALADRLLHIYSRQQYCNHQNILRLKMLQILNICNTYISICISILVMIASGTTAANLLTYLAHGSRQKKTCQADRLGWPPLPSRGAE